MELPYELLDALKDEFALLVFYGSMGGLLLGLIVGPLLGFRGTEIETRTLPNQGIRQSRKNALAVWLLVSLIGGLAFGLLGGLTFGPSGLLTGVVVAGLIGLTIALRFGGIAVLKHFILRVILCCSNYVPWNYVRFLEYATERIFLRKVGGGYVFIHRLLSEHLASIDQIRGIETPSVRDEPRGTTVPSDSQSVRTQPARLRSLLIQTLELLLLVIFLVFGIQILAPASAVVGPAMKPSIMPDDRVALSRMIVGISGLHRGDVIVFSLPNEPSKNGIYRIIGLPGEQVLVQAGRVYIDGELLEEPYAVGPTDPSGEWSLDESEVFVLGDNRGDSGDSRYFGGVPVDSIAGRVMFVFWPIDRMGRIPRVSYTSSAAMPPTSPSPFAP